MKRMNCFFLFLVLSCLSIQVHADKKPVKAILSPPYSVVVGLRFSSPFVPDGRISFAEFAFNVTFKPAIFEFDPNDKILLLSSYCYVDTEEGKGWITACLLNDVEPESPRHHARFIKEPQKQFAAALEVPDQIQDTGDSNLEIVPLVPIPPKKVQLCFRTLFGRNAIEWGAKEGSSRLAEQEIKFEVPWPKLLKGEHLSVTLPYKGAFPEDKGSWWIEFLPNKRKTN